MKIECTPVYAKREYTTGYVNWETTQAKKHFLNKSSIAAMSLCEPWVKSILPRKHEMVTISDAYNAINNPDYKHYDTKGLCKTNI